VILNEFGRNWSKLQIWLGRVHQILLNFSKFDRNFKPWYSLILPRLTLAFYYVPVSIFLHEYKFVRLIAHALQFLYFSDLLVRSKSE
jgi:hypothetical protein